MIDDAYPRHEWLAYALSPEGVNDRVALFVAPAFAWSHAARAAVFLAGCGWYANRVQRPFLDLE